MKRRLACTSIVLFALAALAGCNPTWTKDGKPNDSSMPMPPGASAPQQAGAAPTSSAADPRPPFRP